MRAILRLRRGFAFKSGRLAFVVWAMGASMPVAAQQETGNKLAEPSGKALFEQNCSTCHRASGIGPYILFDQNSLGLTASEIKTIVSYGLSDEIMPAFGDVLSEAEIAALADFIVSYRKSLPGHIKLTPAVDAVGSAQDEVLSEDWAVGVKEPWAIAFTGPDEALITEKRGRLRLIKAGQVQAGEIKNIPKVNAAGQGGLFDIALDPDYAKNGWVYLAFAHSLPGKSSPSMTKIIRGRIEDGIWTDEQTLFAAKKEHYVSSRVHYGGRLAFDDKGYLYFSIGDRGRRDEAQDISRPNGKIHRIHKNGDIPEDNPFMDKEEAYKTIYSYGHRNPQGLVWYDAQKALWETEHGPRGGDELNLIEAGKNYGWPVISYGMNYNGTVLTRDKIKAGMEQPESQWTPSIAVSGLTVYQGDKFPAWRGRLLAGSLKYQSLRLIDIERRGYRGEVELLKNTGRIREAVAGPDGLIYVALPSKIVRLAPRTLMPKLLEPVPREDETQK